MTDNALSDAAVNAALSQNWSEAICFNKQILEQTPQDIGALNRLGFALLKSGKIPEGKHIFEKVLKIDQYNRIAENNLKKIILLKKNINEVIADYPISPLLFLEEPGKTKIVECVNAASSQTLSTLSCGQEVFFRIKKHGIDIRDSKNIYIGALPDDLAFKLLILVGAGNQYTIHIKSITKSCVSIFIREMKRGKKFLHQASFTESIGYNTSNHDTQTDVKGNNEEKEEDN